MIQASNSISTGTIIPAKDSLSELQSLSKETTTVSNTEKDSDDLKQETASTGTSAEGTVTVGVSFDGDTAEISEKAIQTALKSADSAKTLPPPKAEANLASTAVETPPQEDSTETTNTTNLGQYSESQLKNMVSQGTITQSQYINEMRSRTEKTEQ